MAGGRPLAHEGQLVHRYMELKRPCAAILLCRTEPREWIACIFPDPGTCLTTESLWSRAKGPYKNIGLKERTDEAGRSLSTPQPLPKRGRLPRAEPHQKSESEKGVSASVIGREETRKKIATNKSRPAGKARREGSSPTRTRTDPRFRFGSRERRLWHVSTKGQPGFVKRGRGDSSLGGRQVCRLC
jgi:hypothetical protein